MSVSSTSTTSSTGLTSITGSSAASSTGGTYGLSGSGIDVDALVKKLMAGQQAVDDALVQKQTVLQWQKAAYNTVTDDLNNFSTNTVFNYKLQATLSPNLVTSSNTSVATATANAGAANITHSLVVSQLASGVNLTSSKSISAANQTLGNLETQMGLNANSFTFTISNGSSVSQPITIDPSSDSINDVVSAINNAGVNVTASYDSTLDRVFLSTTNTGSSTGISMSSTSTDATSFINGLNLFPTTSPVTDSNGVVTTGGESTSGDTTTFTSTPGQDAQFTLDNATLTESKNAFTISGVTYNLTGVSPTTTSGSSATQTPTTISVAADIDTEVANIQTFVNSYNTMLAEVNGDISQARYTDYPPLTSAQESAMSASDITLWNAKAQSGMLYNDDTLTSLVNTMRNAISSPISGIAPTNVNGTSVTYNTAASIGITTGSYTENGKLYLNKDTLRAALQANPNVLQQIFGTSGTSTTVNGVTTTNTATQGIAGRLSDAIKNTTTQLTQIAGTTVNASYDTSSNLAKQIASYTTQITAAQATFSTMQSQYYTQYNAMEVALQSLSAQSSWITSMTSTTSS
ncbi:MAG: flagellar filament capping protein FliD [Desulfosporosinus sp.]|nr:flagellar filament capping protein FliD [Desulfosporosinus sp.]